MKILSISVEVVEENRVGLEIRGKKSEKKYCLKNVQSQNVYHSS